MNIENTARTNSGLEEELDHAAEGLITGDSDGPPLDEETVVEMVRLSHVHKDPEMI